ncbi:thylakoid lumenal 19 kDa protein, chloroplastic [Silene latifolia]|uniref:thylakoid lumenal 19 kDa protein, chloroplastic n=1 Tax=Silene latifolia TaxID=37657 RepID=UPI003D776B6D
MATLLSPWSLLPTNNNLKPQQQPTPTNLTTTTTTTTFPPQKHPLSLTNLTTTLTAATTTFLILTSPTPSLAATDTPTPYTTYYGTAASAANYGGYGGNSSKKDSAEYIYDVPSGWKERLVSKVEKGTNGTDSEFYNPKKKTEKEYLTYLSGFRQLAPKEVILNNLALSDVNLQDKIASADSVTAVERKDESGQVYYDYEIAGVSSHSLISVTCAKNKLYAHFVNAPAPEWNRDQDMLRHVHQSFKTVDFSQN